MIDASDNALHAAQTWLQRIRADIGSVAVVTIAPTAAVGVWTAGDTNVRRMTAALDDAACELCEAAGPAAAQALQQLADAQREQALAAVRDGARLQLLLAPASGELALRLDRAGRVVMLAGRAAVETLH